MCDRFHPKSRATLSATMASRVAIEAGLVNEGGEYERDQHGRGRGDGDRQDEHQEVRAGLGADAQVRHRDQGEDEQRDGAADRGDRVQLEHQREDQAQASASISSPFWTAPSFAAISGGNCLVSTSRSLSPIAGYSPALVAPAVANSAVTVISQ